MQAAADLGKAAIQGGDLPALLAQAAHSVASELAVELSSILELLPSGEAMFQAGVGWREDVVGQATVEMSGESAAGYVVRTLKPLVSENVESDGRFLVSKLLRDHHVISQALVPLLGRHRPLGVLAAHSTRPRIFTADETAWLEVLAGAISPALERKWLKPEHDVQLLRAEQMMAIGQVAAGVAHELRNPLTSIKGLVQVNLREQQARVLPADDLAVIEHEIRRMERTLQTFLDFARPPKPDRRLLDLPTVVERVLALVGGRARKQGVALRFTPSASAIEAEVDRDQMQQLLLNLVLNALDAMPNGGSIEVDLYPPQGGFVSIAVRDTGPGIAPEILPKVFETFVSSKETGVGLGLPLSRRIAEDHGGSLTAYNLPVAGACFLVRLPVRAG
jgi:signal transduction histidine kinase